MQPRAWKRKRGPTIDFFQVFPSLLVLILLLGSRAAQEQQIPELVDDERRETAQTEIDVCVRGGSTIAPEKAIIEDTSRGEENHGTNALVGPMDSERLDEEDAPSGRDRKDAILSAFSSTDHIKEQRATLDRVARADGDHAHVAPTAVASTPPSDSSVAFHDDDAVNAEWESCVEAENKKDAGGSVRSATCRQGSPGRANGSTFERKSNGGAGEHEDQQENKDEGKQQRQGREGGGEGARKPEYPEMLGSPATANVDQGELVFHSAVDDGGHASNVDAGDNHVHGSSSLGGENQGGVATPSERLPFDTHEGSRSDGKRDDVQMQNTAVSIEPVPEVYDALDSHEHRSVEHRHGSGDAESPPEDSGGGGYPANAAAIGDRTSRDSHEARMRLETEDPHRGETPAVATSKRRNSVKEADDVDRVGAGRGGKRMKGEDWRGDSAKVEVGLVRGSPKELAQRVIEVESELARKLSVEEEDAKSLLDIWVEQAREFVLTRTVPPTDSECDFNWTRLRCEPKCMCGSRLRFGDYTPGRSCRILHPWERSPDCEDAWDPSDEPALRRLGASAVRMLGAAKRAYDSRVAPPTDPECSFDLETMRCEPRPACHLRFRWGDITLSSSCRLAREVT